MGFLGEKKEGIYIKIVILCVGVFVTMKYLLPLFLPFVLAFLFVSLLNPWLSRINEKTHVNKGLLAGSLLFFLAFFLGILICLLAGTLFTHAGDIASEVNEIGKQVDYVLADCCELLEEKFGLDAMQVRGFVIDQVDEVQKTMKVEMAPKLMDQSVYYMKKLVSLAAGFFITAISVILLAKDYQKIMEMLKKSRYFSVGMEVVCKIIELGGVFFKTQGIIWSVISALCCVGYWLVGFEHFLGIGILTGFLDMLPFIGTGLMILPMAFFAILQGYWFRGIGLTVLYVICVFTREFLEPKLIGQKIGILPIGILITIYVGIQLYGLAGIILGPLSALLIFEVGKRITG